MIELIDEAIKSLTAELTESKYKGSPDGALKFTQSVVNLTHAKLNLVEYDRTIKEQDDITP